MPCTNSELEEFFQLDFYFWDGVELWEYRLCPVNVELVTLEQEWMPLYESIGMEL